MADVLSGRRIAFLATHGVERVELVEPLEAVRREGAETHIVGLEEGEIQSFDHMEKAAAVPVDRAVREADPDDYDGLVLPGGVANPDKLRMDPDAVAFVRAFVTQGKPVAVICHGPWTLVEADVVRGRTLTSYPSVRTDIRNAGGTWVDAEVHVDGGLVSSRRPDDLPAFCRATVQVMAAARARAAGAAR
jgi:protease I